MNLRTEVVKLAQENPLLRAHLLPILDKTAAEDPWVEWWSAMREAEAEGYRSAASQIRFSRDPAGQKTLAQSAATKLEALIKVLRTRYPKIRRYEDWDDFESLFEVLGKVQAWRNAVRQVSKDYVGGNLLQLVESARRWDSDIRKEVQIYQHDAKAIAENMARRA